MVSSSVPNSGLFEKNLGKISAVTIGRFGGTNNVVSFLEDIAKCGSITRAAESLRSGNGSNAISPSPLYVQRIINDDRYLSRCVAMAKQIAVEKCESVLYERAINGYEEITYDSEGRAILRKRKYCSKSLMEYLKANNEKYRSIKAGTKTVQENNEKDRVNMENIEVESYADYGKT